MLHHLLQRMILLSMLAMISKTSLGYPTRLLHMTYRNGAYQKNIFFIGDIHCIARENSRNGKLRLKGSDDFFRELIEVTKAWASFPLLWEVSPNSCQRNKAKFYLQKKSIELQRIANKRSPVVIVPCDQLRNKNSILKRFMLDTHYRPQNAIRKLESEKYRDRLVSAISSTLLSPQGNMFERSLSRAILEEQIPAEITSPVSDNFDWYRAKVSHLLADLKFNPQELVSQTPHSDYKNILSRTTADLEIMSNIFSRPEQAVLVYAGDAHVRRLKNFLYRVGFRSVFELERHGPPGRRDFFYFLKEFEQLRLEGRNNLAMNPYRLRRFKSKPRRNSSNKGESTEKSAKYQALELRSVRLKSQPTQ